jgi:hypothetical protein
MCPQVALLQPHETPAKVDSAALHSTTPGFAEMQRPSLLWENLVRSFFSWLG